MNKAQAHKIHRKLFSKFYLQWKSSERVNKYLFNSLSKNFKKKLKGHRNIDLGGFVGLNS